MERYYLMVIAQKVRSVNRLSALRARFGSMREVWCAPSADLLNQVPPATLVALDKLRHEQPHLPEKVAEDCQRKDIKLSVYSDDDYPALLREIDSPPAGLFYRGALRAEALRIAMVGSRQGTTYGRNVAAEFAQELCRRGLTVVSGAARGIDTASHLGALRVPTGRTVAVLGCGVDVAYPSESRELLAQIVERGAVISEYLPGTRPSQWQFLPRNRIISGLSLGTVIVEAGARSGALNTASWASKQNREVFAVPGSINAAQSVGTNDLIQRSYAKLVCGVDDILSEIRECRPLTQAQLELDLTPPRQAALPPPTPTPPAPVSTAVGEDAMSPDERAVYNALERDNDLDVDEIIKRLGERVTAADVSVALVTLELCGAVTRNEIGNYRQAQL